MPESIGREFPELAADRSTPAQQLEHLQVLQQVHADHVRFYQDAEAALLADHPELVKKLDEA